MNFVMDVLSDGSGLMAKFLYFNYLFHIVLLIDSFIILGFKHEPLARATGQPCLTYDNKLD